MKVLKVSYYSIQLFNMSLNRLSDALPHKHAPISCLSIPSSHCSLAVEMLMVSVGLLFTTVMDALDRRSSVR